MVQTLCLVSVEHGWALVSLARPERGLARETGWALCLSVLVYTVVVHKQQCSGDYLCLDRGPSGQVHSNLHSFSTVKLTFVLSDVWAYDNYYVYLLVIA